MKSKLRRSLYIFSDVPFIRYPKADCLYGNDLKSMPSDKDSDHQPCKEWCASRDDCYAFIVSAGLETCYFKASGCKSFAFVQPGGTLYLKRLS